MARSSGMVTVMAIVLLVALLASPAKSAGRGSLADDAAGGANAAAAMAPSDVVVVSRPAGTDLVFCVRRTCIYPGRGSSDCYCCATDKKCYDTRDKCNAQCI